MNDAHFIEMTIVNQWTLVEILLGDYAIRDGQNLTSLSIILQTLPDCVRQPSTSVDVAK